MVELREQPHFGKQNTIKSVKATSLSGVYQYTNKTAINSSNRTLIPSSKEVLKKQYKKIPAHVNIDFSKANW